MIRRLLVVVFALLAGTGNVLAQQDVQLQKAVEMLKTWKIFKELPRPS